MEEEKILLILAANPFIDRSLQFDKEIKEIKNIFDKRDLICHLKVVNEMVVTWRDLQNSFLKFKPFIMHFIGHGEENGIVLHSMNSEYEIVCSDDLLRLVGLFSKMTKCIFLNSCNSNVIAQVISQKIDYVVSIEGEINDVLAIDFALAFYDAISFGSEIDFAFEFAMVTYVRNVSMNIAKFQHCCPRLYKKGMMVNKIQEERNISPSRLPSFGIRFVGRNKDSEILTDAWNNEKTNILVVEAWGGVGKTTLVSRWRTYFVTNKIYSKDTNVFDWTFHRQEGATSQPYTSEDFMDCALKWFGVNYAKESSPSEKGEFLAKAVQRSKTLFILDGVESVQSVEAYTDGMIMDDAVKVFICSLAEYNPGLCIITTRKHIVELNKYEGLTCKTHLLKNLDYDSSTELLKMLGTHGSDSDYKKIYDVYKGHPLSISLLGTYVRDNLDGRLDTSEFKLFEEDRVVGNFADAIMKYYDNIYRDGYQLNMLRVLSLFDRAVEYSELQMLFDKPGVAHLTDGLPKIFSLQWGALIRYLKNAQLIMEYCIGEEVFLDIHPMIREYYNNQLKQEFSDSYVQGNRYLSDYYIMKAEEQYNEHEKINYYFRAMIHGCKAGEYLKMYKEIYLPCIKHYEISHDARRYYGGYGTNLDAISNFFKEKWDELYVNENDEMKADLFAEAAFALMCMGENERAIEPFEKAIEIEQRLRNYKKLATDYGHLSEVYLSLGKIKKALGVSICGIGVAELCDEIGRHNWAQMTKCANVLNQLGRREVAQTLFNDAELLQRKYDKNAPNLYGILAYKSHDTVLSFLEDKLLHKRLGISNEIVVEYDVSKLEEKINSAIEHAQNSGNSLHLGVVYISLVRLKLIQYMISSKGSFDEIGNVMSEAMQFANRAGRKEYLIYALLTYGRYYGIFRKEEEATTYFNKAKDLATHYNFNLAQIDICIELLILKIQYDKYDEVQAILCKEIYQNEFVNTYGKRTEIIDTISGILKNKRRIGK